MKPFAFDLYWSFRSPYCYLAMDRLFALADERGAEVHIRHVWPGAMRRAGYFNILHANYPAYHRLDAERLAEFLNIPFARPVPDPLVFEPDSREPLADQPHIRQLTRRALAARALGQERSYLAALMRLLWDGRVRGWDAGNHLTEVAATAGLSAAEIDRFAENKADAYDREVDENGDKLVATGHWGVPCMVLEGEPFFGQDRIEVLAWRLRQKAEGPL